MEEDGTFEKVREFVRQQQEQRGREQPIELGEISAELQIPHEDILEALTDRILTGELVGTDILLTFTE